MRRNSLPQLACSATAFCYALFLPAPSHATPPASRDIVGFESGLRVGVEVPVGDIDSGHPFRQAALNGIAQYRVPVWLDVGYRISAAWWLGIGAQVGSGAFGDSCPSAAECDWSDVRVHAQLQYHFDPLGAMELWVGAALGWESLRASITQETTTQVDGKPMTVAVKARELLGGPQLLLQGGLHFAIDEGLRFGPYATAALGQYVTASFDCPAGLCDELEADESRLHAWFGLGLRGSYGP